MGKIHISLVVVSESNFKIIRKAKMSFRIGIVSPAKVSYHLLSYHFTKVNLNISFDQWISIDLQILFGFVYKRNELINILLHCVPYCNVSLFITILESNKSLIGEIKPCYGNCGESYT